MKLRHLILFFAVLAVAGAPAQAYSPWSASLPLNNGGIGGGIGACSISFTSTQPSTLNLSTEGTFDWFAPSTASVLENYRGSGAVAHNKVLGGGYIPSTFDFVETSSTVLFNQTSAMSLTSTIGDDISIALSSYNTQDAGIDCGGACTGTNWGFRFAELSKPTTRTMRIYGSQFSAATTLSVAAGDNSFTTCTNTQDAGTSILEALFWTVTYNTAFDADVKVSVLNSTNHGSTPNVKIIAVTVQ